MLHYFVIYKPYGVLNQFTDDLGRPTLASLYDFPKDVYPVGRLDIDSEGLLLLTNDKSVNHRLLNPKFKHTKTYWVQVEGQITQEAIQKLESGLDIRIEGKMYHTLPAKAFIFETPPQVPERNPPIRFRKNIPTSWISLSIVEGKKHQVRKMTAAVGFPTLRLIRYQIQHLTLENMQVGEVRKLSQKEVYQKLFGKG
ncbi:pseudouridine synthase [Raineya orbicola]|jgi:23S rRNA pseudouridine2457 synthase|uniref:Pseudouridine synthase n=1 Tax=Raineya orbicola TaxID=2016530 RepID=A0A2N3IGC1_9BACT|nr:pseudouridine synthase [Raineya orbicola]PKQ69308.1 Pseudouridine synthase [Raineya orbicola]